MEEEANEMKYRQFRWLVDVDGIMPHTMSRVDMLWDERRTLKLDLTFYYINDMEPGVCPVSTQWPKRGTLKLLAEDGSIIRTCEFDYYLDHYIPIVKLDYTDSNHIQGRVRLGIREQNWF